MRRLAYTVWSVAASSASLVMADAPPGRYEATQESVLDVTTKLMWQRRPPTETMGYEQATAYCETLELAGFSDWRLPRPTELTSIVDVRKHDPALDTNVFDTPKQLTYWSSVRVTSPQGSDVGYYVNFSWGELYYGGLQEGWSVRCVRVAGA